MPPRKQAPQPLPTTKLDTEQQEPVVQVNDMTKTSGDIHTLASAASSASERISESIAERTSESICISESHNYDENHSFAETDEKSLATVHVYEDNPEGHPVKRNENWVVVEELSDDEFQVEVANIDGYQMRKSILRFRVRGELMPNVVVMDGIRYHPTQGFQKR